MEMVRVRRGCRMLMLYMVKGLEVLDTVVVGMLMSSGMVVKCKASSGGFVRSSRVGGDVERTTGKMVGEGRDGLEETEGCGQKFHSSMEKKSGAKIRESRPTKVVVSCVVV